MRDYIAVTKCFIENMTSVKKLRLSGSWSFFQSYSSTVLLDANLLRAASGSSMDLRVVTAGVGDSYCGMVLPRASMRSIIEKS